MNNKGFTLVELLIVIAIIGILAVAIVPNILGYTDDADAAAIQSDYDVLRTAYHSYVLDKGEDPEYIDDLTDY